MTAYPLGVEISCDGPTEETDCPDSAAIRARFGSLTTRRTGRTTVTETPTPAKGQIWQDNDPRADERLVWIERVDDTHAHVRQVALTAAGEPVPLPGVRRTRIRLDRFRPTSNGYRFVAA